MQSSAQGRAAPALAALNRHLGLWREQRTYSAERAQGPGGRAEGGDPSDAAGRCEALRGRRRGRRDGGGPFPCRRSETAVAALETASRPLLDRLSGVVRAADEAEHRLWSAVAAFGWRWVALTGGTAAGGIAAVLLAGWLVVWWQRHEVEQLAMQRQALAARVAQWQVQAEA